jgi:hypothetical protein
VDNRTPRPNDPEDVMSAALGSPDATAVANVATVDMRLEVVVIWIVSSVRDRNDGLL